MERGVWLIPCTLPKAKVKASQFSVHISYFLQNCKKSRAKWPSDFDITYSGPISR